MVLSDSNVRYMRILSDLHLDWDVSPKKTKSVLDLWYPPVAPTDSNTVLVLAGDIWRAKKLFKFMGDSYCKELSRRFRYVVFVLGNHDFWDGNIHKLEKRYQDYIKDQDLKNVFLLENSQLIINDHKFLGATLWTDYNGGCPEAMRYAEIHMNDFKYIRQGNAYINLKAHTILDVHRKSKDYLFTNAKKDHDNQKVVVITHHAPSARSYGKVGGNKEKPSGFFCYYSDLDEDIKQSQIDMWIHGHIHTVSNYRIGNTQVLCNPRGYSGLEETQFNEGLLFEL